MKPQLFRILGLCACILAVSCKKPIDAGDGDRVGLLRFKTYNPLRPAATGFLLHKSAVLTPALTGDITTLFTTSMKFCVGDVWVSQEEVREGEPDTLEWVRLSDTTNTEYRLFENYSFPVISIPGGTYKSIKITFKNVFYRYSQLVSDTAVAYEFLETMGSWTDSCNLDDTSWARTNYFGPDGNHILADGDTFELVVPGEKLGGFTIEAGKTAVVTWRLGAGAVEPCTTFVMDQNANRQWDCGVDRMDFACPPGVHYMWDFVVAYE